METIEILAGGRFTKAVQDLGLASASRVYRYRLNQSGVRENYQVWKLSKEDFDKLCAIKDDDWKNKWGWWRYAAGSNLGDVTCEYIINGRKLKAWDGSVRTELKELCPAYCSDYESGICGGTSQDIDECFNNREYPDIITYLREEIGASTEKNVCACTVDLARQNGMKLSELFKQYLG